MRETIDVLDRIPGHDGSDESDWDAINRVIPLILSIIEAVIRVLYSGKHSRDQAFPSGDRSPRVHRATALLMEHGRFGNNAAKVS